MRVGLVGLGTIGRAIATALDVGDIAAQLTAVSSRNLAQARVFASTLRHPPAVVNIADLITRCDLVIEAATQEALPLIVPPCVQAGKHVMVLSVGGLLDYPEWPALAAEHGARLYVPSGAIVGLDGVKGACVGEVTSVTITTRKPPRGLAGAPYVEARGIDVYAFTEETMIFEGTAREACKGFPANVNVSAALSLAGIGPDRTTIRIFVAPGSLYNRHDIEVLGEFGRLTTHIENVPSDSNPRTGKLSYLSALAMLKTLVSPLHCGT